MHKCLIYIAIDSDQLSLYFRYLSNLSLVVASHNQTQFKKQCLETGLSGSSIFSGLPLSNILSIPFCFPTNLMHLGSLNLPDLFVNLWHGTLTCGISDSVTTWGLGYSRCF